MASDLHFNLINASIIIADLLVMNQKGKYKTQRHVKVYGRLKALVVNKKHSGSADKLSPVRPMWLYKIHKK